MKTTLCSLLAAAMFMAPGASQSAELLLEYTFNDSGPRTQGSERSAWDWPLDFQTQDGDPADWHGAPGSGVSGLSADRAFDNSASTQMGSGGLGGRAWGEPGSQPAQDSITFSGWFRTEAVPAGAFGRLFFWGGGHQVYASPDATLRLAVGNNRSVRSEPAYSEIDAWVFFAVTFDGTESADNVHFWKGTRSTPVTPAGTRTLPTGPFEPGSSRFCLGNSFANSTPTQPFDGWLDNFRFYGGSGSSGVLSEAELESLRAADVAGDAPPLRLRVPLEVEVISGPPAGLRFGWWSVMGYRYQLQQSTSLNTWEDVPSVSLEGDGNRQEPTLTPAPARPTFYRLRVTPL